MKIRGAVQVAQSVLLRALIFIGLFVVQFLALLFSGAIGPFSSPIGSLHAATVLAGLAWVFLPILYARRTGGAVVVLGWCVAALFHISSVHRGYRTEPAQMMALAWLLATLAIVAVLFFDPPAYLRKSEDVGRSE
ncbi:hypothetical protein [Roseateles sp. BYS87W]|uniref:Uncharacterized protein n=1 Tax=Pelomonas baiyunensis TaxID=3299026 RepID=A0ABW7GUH9_9BURK